MFNNIRIPQTIATLERVLGDLANQPAVLLVNLATADGVPITTSTNGGRVAAASGFLVTAAQQTFAMLSLGETSEVVIYGMQDHFIVCRTFNANGARLILTILFDAPTSYKRMIAQMVRTIQQIMEQE